MAISIVSIVKNSLKFSLVKIISAFLGLAVLVYAGRILAPEEFGVFGFLSLWLTYAGLIGPGIASAGSREMPVLIGRDQPEEALSIQNISVSSEILYAIIPFAVILGASLFYSDSVLKVGLVVIAATHMVTRLANLWSLMNFIRERFNIVAVGSLIIAIVSPLITLAGVQWLRVYALLIGPLAANIVVWIFYLKKGRINYHFRLDRREITRLLKAGVVLQALTLVFWASRWADRTVIASTLPFEQLGFYTFAMGFLMYGLALSIDFGNVLQPVLWREVGKGESISEGFQDTKRIAVYLALGTAIIIPIAQLAFHLIVGLITPNYSDSIPIFYVVSYNIYLASMVLIPNLILTSSLVNRQNISLYVFSAGLVLNVVFDLLIIKLGFGVMGVAWVTLGVQCLVTALLYYSIKGYIFKDMREFLRFQARIVFPFLVIMPFYFLHGYLGLLTSSLWALAGVSLVTQIIMWGVVIGVFYRGYLSIRDMAMLVQEIRVVILRIRDSLSIKSSV